LSSVYLDEVTDGHSTAIYSPPGEDIDRDEYKMETIMYSPSAEEKMETVLQNPLSRDDKNRVKTTWREQ
jgi:hypothetical protein